MAANPEQRRRVADAERLVIRIGHLYCAPAPSLRCSSGAAEHRQSDLSTRFCLSGHRTRAARVSV
eukprot:7904860-Alexandrium_andersonii.AAC.1